MVHPLPNGMKPQPVLPGSQPMGFPETYSIIFHRDNQLVPNAMKYDPGMMRLRVFDNVMQQFANGLKH